METTTTVATCGGCGERTPIGAAHVYRGAGFVLRCPGCEDAPLTLVRDETRMWIGCPGIRTLQVSVESP